MTIFTWGYWGWGQATSQLVEAATAVERARGFEPPIFVDLRFHRDVRAAGFRGSAFADVVGRDRYVWLPRLGNAAIRGSTQRDRSFRIADPEAAIELLDLAESAARANRRVVAFCSCWSPLLDGRLHCHRCIVADLVRRVTIAKHVACEVEEWPGGVRRIVGWRVSVEECTAVLRGRKSIALDHRLAFVDACALAYGSLLVGQTLDGVGGFRAVLGPARYSRGNWKLPLFARRGLDDNTANEDFSAAAEKWRLDNWSVATT